jgi:hypothetical protein
MLFRNLCARFQAFRLWIASTNMQVALASPPWFGTSYSLEFTDFQSQIEKHPCQTSFSLLSLRIFLCFPMTGMQRIGTLLKGPGWSRKASHPRSRMVKLPVLQLLEN